MDTDARDGARSRARYEGEGEGGPLERILDDLDAIRESLREGAGGSATAAKLSMERKVMTVASWRSLYEGVAEGAAASKDRR